MADNKGKGLKALAKLCIVYGDAQTTLVFCNPSIYNYSGAFAFVRRRLIG